MEKVHDNTIKDNVTMTSSSFWNDKDFEDFEKLTYFSDHEDDIQS